METLGRYKVLKEIGRGSMGVIYLGYDPEIQRTVAIKTIRWDLIQANIGPEEAFKRFKNEVTIVGKLEHTNIVTLFDTGEAEGNSYFVMEYVEGRTLASLIRTDGAPSVGRAVEILRSIAQGLSYAHGKDVIHRDIKPSNVMISNEGQVKITDFGIARCTTLSSNMTRSLTGTPKYISPEQVEGKQIDHRSDIFSLGVVAYELLTGEAVFEGETLSEIIQKVVHDVPHPPSSVNPAIPPALDGVVMKALEKDPDMRHPDMIAFGDALLVRGGAPGHGRNRARHDQTSRTRSKGSRGRGTGQQGSPLSRRILVCGRVGRSCLTGLFPLWLVEVFRADRCRPSIRGGHSEDARR